MGRPDRRRRALWIAGALAFVVVAWYANRPTPAPPEPSDTTVVRVPGYSSDGNLENPSASDLSQVRALLDARAKAMLHHHRAAFVRGLDPGDHGFDRAQEVVFDNARHFPLQQLGYEVESVVYPDHTLTTPTLLVRVRTTYQLRGYDTAPVQVEDGYSFVQQDGHWVLSSTSQADHQFRQDDLPPPWDGRAVTTYDDHHYLAVVDAGEEQRARRIVALCHRVESAAHDLLGVSGEHPTVVIATTRSKGFAGYSSDQSAAVTYPVLADDHVVSWRMAVNPRVVPQVLSEPTLLTHELTHLATQEYLPSAPKWLSEGAAELVSFHDQGGLRAALSYHGWGQGRPLHLESALPISSQAFYGDRGHLHYVESTAAVTWLVEHRGASTIGALFRAYRAAATAAGGRIDPDLVTDRLLARVAHVRKADLLAGAYQELRDTIGG